jgi:hypothetical protein
MKYIVQVKQHIMLKLFSQLQNFNLYKLLFKHLNLNYN